MHKISLWIGKITYSILRLLNKRGAALPGLIVEKLDHKFLGDMLSKLPDGVIVISGTNGKTTSTKMLSSILKKDKKVLTNPTGSNFTRGIIATIVQHSTWLGKLNYDIAVIELDEAYAAKFVEQVRPRGVVILNVMRDQMDRFGEIDHTARLLEKVVKKATEFVVLNADDSRVNIMSKSAKAEVYYFGVSEDLRNLYKADDELHSEVNISNRSELSVELISVKPGIIKVLINKQILELPIKLPGTYNAQNATAVITTANALKINVDDITTKISTVKAAFGRGETIEIGSKKVILQLVKNPGGFRHSLIGADSYNANNVMIAINDDYADGRDVSWLWDVIFKNHLKYVDITTGTRAYDMALRLAYDDVPTNSVNMSLKEALLEGLSLLKNDQTLLIFTTYTAMLSLRAQLAKITKVEKV